MYRLASIVVLLLGVFFVVYSYELSVGQLSDPGPGLWPFLVSIVIVLSGAALLFTERSGDDYEHLTARSKFIGIGLFSLIAFIPLFAWIGFTIPGFLILVFWLRFLGNESWRLTLVLSGLLTTVFYILFVPALGVPFPDDLLISIVGS